MGRDPEDGMTSDPKSLHKYLYADGDPVNGIDPTGRAYAGAWSEPVGGDDLGEYIGLVAGLSLVIAAQHVHPIAMPCAADGAAGLLGRPGLLGNPCEPQKPPKTCKEKHPDWPVNWVHFSTTPTIAAHIAGAINIGYTDELTYLGPYNPQTKANRAAACPSGKYSNIGMTCDEYPYASTVQRWGVLFNCACAE
jgi:hypothetical protein